MARDSEAEALRLASAGRFAEALPWAQRAVGGLTACQPAHGMLANLLIRLGRVQDAESVVQEALALEPASADALEALAHVSMQLGRHERSNALYRRALALAPGDGRFWYNFASSERSVGRLREAEDACNEAIARDPARYASYLLRSELRTQTAGSNHVAELEALLARPGLPGNAQMFIGYALAKELDDLHRHDESFRQLVRASAIRRRNLSYDVEVDLRKLARIESAYPREVIERTSTAADTQRYIFIVGLPRSGTTLLEHVLLGLPGVGSNGETENFSRALFGAPSIASDDPFARAAAADQDAVAALYRTFAGGETGRGRIVEKLPMNYLYAGAIRRALPQSAIVHLRRHPLDSCFAMFRTLFGEAYPFTYDFDDLARYFAAYCRLMDHWRACFGTTIHEVAYEEFVSDPAGIGSGVAAHCGLDWRDSALEVQTRAGVSFTASAAQIRSPIHSGSAGRWRRYRAQLEPLARALNRLGVATPD